MSAQTGHMLYFAYGEDLPRSDFSKAFPGAEWFGPARLEAHRLVADVAGRANVRAEVGATVWGALWLVPAALLADLDAHAPHGHERTTRRIVSPAGPCTEATLYLSAGSAANPYALANVERLLEGARENRLPASYAQELSRVVRGDAGADAVASGKTRSRSGKSRKDSH
jgi:hypothetical protein